ELVNCLGTDTYVHHAIVCNVAIYSISPPSSSASQNQCFQNFTKPARNVYKQSLGRRVWSNSHFRQRFHCQPLFPRRNTHCKESRGVFELDFSKNHFIGRTSR